MKKPLLFSILALLILSAIAFATFSSITLTGPTNGAIISGTSVNFNWTVRGANVSGFNLTYNNGTEKVKSLSLTTANCSISGDTYTCKNVTTMPENINVSYYITAWDVFNSSFNSSVYSFQYDNSGIIIANTRNWTISSSNINWNIGVNDYSPNACKAQIFLPNGSGDYIFSANISGTWARDNTQSNCTGTITSSLISQEGNFRIRYFVSDRLGNSNTSNVTGVKTNLFTGWNAVTYADTNASGGNDTLQIICSRISYCSMISKYGGVTFTTYSTLTPTVNNETKIAPGEPLMIYVTASDYLIGVDRMSNSDPVVTLSNATWQMVGMIGNSNVSKLLTATNVTYASYIANNTYTTCRRSINLCAGTSSTPDALTLYKGYGTFVLVNRTTTLNRSTIIG